MKCAQAVLSLSIGILFILASLGCGSGNSTSSPGTAVNHTQNPLVVQYSIPNFHVGLSAWVEFGTDTNYGRKTSVMTSSVTSPGGQTLDILVAGMKPQTTYHMRAHVTWASGSWVDQDHTFTTGALPTALAQALPTFSITRPASGTQAGITAAPGVELLSLVAFGNTPVPNGVVTDLQGNIIWYCPPTGSVPIKPMQNGHFMLIFGKSGLGGTDLEEVDLTCNAIRDISVTQVNQSLQKNGYSFSITNFHHDILELSNGHWIALGQISRDFTDLDGYSGPVLGDAILDIDPNGNVVWAWSTFDHMDVHRHPYFLFPDWTHSNALVYTPDGNLLLSVRNQSWVLKIDYANGTGAGDILWRLGNGGDFTLSSGIVDDWFYAQHYPNLLSTNGSQLTLAVFDDGDARPAPDGLGCGSTATEPPCYTRATIFQADESTHLATLQWQDLPNVYTFWGGSINTLSNGDVEFAISDVVTTSESQIMEVTQSSNPQTVWQMNIKGAFAYRGYRIPSLYPGITWQQ